MSAIDSQVQWFKVWAFGVRGFRDLGFRYNNRYNMFVAGPLGVSTHR